MMTKREMEVKSVWDMAVGTTWETPELYVALHDDRVTLFLQENVQVPGRDVIVYKFSWHLGGKNGVLKRLLSAMDKLAPGLTSETLVAYLRQIELRNPMEGHYYRIFGEDGQELDRERVAGLRVFSKQGIRRLKPLTERPAKITMAHVKRILANGQFKDLRRDRDIHDLGPFPEKLGPLDGLKFLAELINSTSSGWRTGYPYHQPERVHVNNHTYESNSFELAIAR